MTYTYDAANNLRPARYGVSALRGQVLPFASPPGPRESSVTRWAWPFLDKRTILSDIVL